MTMTSVFMPITKSDEQDDGTIFVYGKATDGALDRDQQRCDPDWLNKAMPEWYRTGANIREQHDSKRAVGVGVGHDMGADGHFVRAHIVDPVAVLKVKHGVLKGFSIGISQPNVEKSVDAPNGLINGGNICELSLCDRPSNPGCMLALAKSAKPGMSVKAGDFDSTRLLVRCEELTVKDEEPGVEKSDEMTVTLADSLDPAQVERLEELVADKATAPDAPCCEKCATVGDSCCDMCPPAEKAVRAFDRDEALEIVKAILGKAGKESLGVTVPPVSPPEELPDIMGAKAAIAIIAQLIQSEAADMVCAPNEDYDIECLMQAVSALRVFILREKGELGGDPNLMYLSADPELEKADNEPYGDVEYADPGYQKDKKKRYPIDTKAHAKAAWSYINKGSDASAYSPADLAKVKARIEAACKKFGIDISSDKAADPEVAKTIETEENPVADIIEDVVETVEDAARAVEPELEKAALIEEAAEEAPIEKAATITTEAIEEAIAAALAKAFSAEVLEKEDNPLRKTFTAIVEAATESTAKAVTDVAARLEKVEQMAVPGGPALRRTEIERTNARKNDLEREVLRYKTLASATRSSGDQMLAKGYDHKAAALEADIKAL